MEVVNNYYMSIIKNISIQDKQVLTKIANVLTVFANENEATQDVSIGGNLFYCTTFPEGDNPPITGISVFYDRFVVKETDLPSGPTLEARVIAYVCNTWNLTII